MKPYEYNLGVTRQLADLTAENLVNVPGGGSGQTDDANSDPSLAGAGPNGEDVIRVRINEGGTYRRVQWTTHHVIDAQGSEAADESSAMLCRGSFGVWVKCPDYQDATFGAFAWRDTFNSNGYYQYILTLDDANSRPNSYQDGWQWLTWRPSQMAASGGAPSFGDGQYIDTFYLGIQGSPVGTSYEMLLSGFRANLYQKPIVLIGFDDSNDTDLTIAAPYLQSLGLKATTYTGIDNIGNAGFLSEADLYTLQNTYGWTVASHGGTDLTTMTQGDRLADLQATKDWLASRGFSWKYFAYPLGGFDKPSIDDLESLGFVTARMTTGTPINTTVDPQLMRHGGWGTATRTFTDIKDQLDAAIKSGAVFETYSHRLQSPTPTHTDPDVWKQMMQLIAEYKDQGLVDVMTIDEYYAHVLTQQLTTTGWARDWAQ